MKRLLYFFTLIPLFFTAHASVTSSGVLDPQEIAYKKLRQEYMCQKLSVTHVPTVAVCISGGGLRATIGALGFLKAFSEQGLLDATTYLCGLSGSTWAISGWLQSQLSVADYLNALKPSLAQGLLDNINIKHILDELWKRYESGQEISLDDIWGCLIAQKIIINSENKDLTDITLQNYWTTPSTGELPLPIYNCVIPLDTPEFENNCAGPQQYAWVDWSPFQVRCPILETAISMSEIGSYFKAGNIHKQVPVQSLSWGHGVWGSAISASLQNIIIEYSGTLSGYQAELLYMIENLINTNCFFDELSEIRILPAYIPNWNYQLPNMPLHNSKQLMLLDAAMQCNLSLAPMLEAIRTVDIIVVVDLSTDAGTSSGAELVCAQNYAHAHGLQFPQINCADINKSCSVHKPAPGTNAPTIIYFPLQSDITSTFQLKYTPEETDLLSGIMYTACQENAHIVREIIAIALQV